MEQIADNKRNLLYFEAASMRELHDKMNVWQEEKCKRFLSVSIEKDGENYCCIALSNPVEVVLVNGPDLEQATVTASGHVAVQIG
jgi:hypothetical protein